MSTPFLLPDEIRFAMEPHPVYPAIPVEELIAEGARAEDILPLLAQRHRRIAMEKPCDSGNPDGDPLWNMWQPPSWARAEREIEKIRRGKGVPWLLVQGGKRSSKSTFCAWKVMRTLVEGPNRRAWCFHETQTRCREDQMPLLWNMFPRDWKPTETGRAKRTTVTKIIYAAGSGFSADNFSLPNASRCEFKFYANDEDTLEGSELDVCWCDELVPAHWLDILDGRLFTRGGLGLVSFTAKDGYTATVAKFLDGSRVVEEMDAELLPVRDKDGAVCGYEKVPLVLACREPRRAVVYFPTQENFYANFDNLAETLRGARREKILCDAYGVAVKRFGSVFDLTESNILRGEAVKNVLTNAKDHTWYHICDPAGTRNFFMLWIAVNKMGQMMVMREWPQPEDYIPGVGMDRGVWAEGNGQPNGARGPAQPSFGWTLEQYADEIGRVEKELAEKCEGLKRITVAERIMDSRAGAAPVARTDQSATGETLMDKFLYDLPVEKRLDFKGASGRQRDGEATWQKQIEFLLLPDKLLQTPRLLIAEHCANTIFAFTNYTERVQKREDGGDQKIHDGACWDPVHCVKYAVLEPVEFIEPRPTVTAPPWGGYLAA